MVIGVVSVLACREAGTYQMSGSQTEPRYELAAKLNPDMN